MRFYIDTRQPTSSNLRLSNNRIPVLLALFPGIFTMCWMFGIGVLMNIGLALITAILSECLILRLRKQAILSHLQDLSVVSIAIFIGLSLPSLAPWWLSVIGTAFAVIAIKYFYGGFDLAPLNPAMAGYVLLLISFPQRLATWIKPSLINENPLSFSDTLQMIYAAKVPNHVTFDAIASPTPLDAINTLLTLHKPIPMIGETQTFGHLGGAGWEIISLAYLCGGLWLVYRDYISWAIPAGVLGGLGLFATGGYFLNSAFFATPMLHLFTGATMLGAFFIATDLNIKTMPVRNQFIYGLIIGILTYVIRVAGDYPDGMAFAILVANLSLTFIE